MGQGLYTKMMVMFDNAIGYFKQRAEEGGAGRRGGRRAAAAGAEGARDAGAGGEEEDEEDEEDDVVYETRELKHYAEQVAEEFQLLLTAEAMESASMLAAAEVGGRQDELSGAVRIGMPEGAASHLAPAAVADLVESYPRLEIQIVALPRTFSLSQREADFAIVVTPPAAGRLRIRKIADYRLQLYGAAELLGDHPPRTPDELRRWRLVGYVPDLIFDKGLDYLSEIPGAPTPAVASTSLLVQLEMVAAGAGLGMLPEFMARRRPGLVPVMPEVTRITRAYWLVMHQDTAELARIRRVARAFADAMRARL